MIYIPEDVFQWRLQPFWRRMRPDICVGWSLPHWNQCYHFSGVCSLCIGGCSPGGFCSFRGVSRFWRILKIIVYMCMNLFIQEQDFNISQSISLTLTFKFWSLLLGKPRSFWRVMGFTEEQRSILYLERYIV